MWPGVDSCDFTHLRILRIEKIAGLLKTYPGDLYHAYCNSDNTCCERALDWASIAVAACCNTCERLRLAVSAAKSASTIRERDADVFSEIFARLEMVKSKRLLAAPRSARVAFTCSRALSMIPMAF